MPSPTFTLVQTYEAERAFIWHFDLYRLADPAEAFELGIEEALTEGIVLMEWPERLGPCCRRTGWTLPCRRAPPRAPARWCWWVTGPGPGE